MRNKVPKRIRRRAILAGVGTAIAGCTEGRRSTPAEDTQTGTAPPKTSVSQTSTNEVSGEMEETSVPQKYLINKRLNDATVEDHVSGGLLQTFIPGEFIKDGTLEVEGISPGNSELEYLFALKTVVSDDHALRAILSDEKVEYVDDNYMDVALLGLNRNEPRSFSWKDIVASTIHDNLDTAWIELESGPAKLKESLEYSGEKVRDDRNGVVVKDTVEIEGKEYWWAGGMVPGHSAVVAAVERPADGRGGTPSFDFHWGGTLPKDEGNNAIDYVEIGLKGLRDQYDITKSSEFLDAIGDVAEDGNYNNGTGFPILLRWRVSDGFLSLNLYDINEDGRFVHRIVDINPEIEDHGFHDNRDPLDLRADWQAMGAFIDD